MSNFARSTSNYSDDAVFSESITPFADSERCIMVISGFSRPASLTAMTIHYARMNLFRQVVVSWGNTVSSPPEILLRALHAHEVQDKVAIRREHSDDLNARFSIPADAEGISCVFIVDDDVMVDEEHTILTYHAWKQFPDQIVGAFPRGHILEEGNYKYVSDPTDSYSMVLTKFMVTSKKYLYHYAAGNMTTIRNYVRDKQNCEDIAFNLMVSELTGLPPIYVSIPNKVDFGNGNGLYKRPEHQNERHECVAWMISQLGVCPLKYNSVSFSQFSKDIFLHSSKDADNAIVGAIVGVLILIVICGLGAWFVYCCCCRNNRRAEESLQPRVEMTSTPSQGHPSLHTVEPNHFFRHSYGHPAESSYLGNNQQIPALQNEHQVVEVVPPGFSPKHIRQENNTTLGYPSSDDVLQQSKSFSQSCTNCGSPVAGGAFCANCGTKHSKTSAE